MDLAAREQLLTRVAAYLDSVGDGEPDDQGEPEAAPDLFTLLAELGALKAEVKVESRQVKGALDQFREAFDLVRQAQVRLEDGQAQRIEAERRAREEAERDLLLELLDLRDRLQAGLDQARRYRPGWLARRGGADAFVGAMAEGVAMNLKRLDDTLARRGVKPLRVLGLRFDPMTMHAAEAGLDPALADGLVLAELRRGFSRGERLLRPAEVVVNRLTWADGHGTRAEGHGQRPARDANPPAGVPDMGHRAD
jgi:molecular chaperone GrpE